MWTGGACFVLAKSNYQPNQMCTHPTNHPRTHPQPTHPPTTYTRARGGAFIWEKLVICFPASKIFFDIVGEFQGCSINENTNRTPNKVYISSFGPHQLPSNTRARTHRVHQFHSSSFGISCSAWNSTVGNKHNNTHWDQNLPFLLPRFFVKFSSGLSPEFDIWRMLLL